MDLIALEDIRALKYRYLRTLDLKQWDEFADTMTEDVAASYGTHLSRTGRADVVSFMRDNLGPQIITVHHCHHPEIRVDGDTATGTWCLDDTVIATEHRIMIRGSAFYTDRYVREGGEWRIARTGYERTYEATLSLDDVPSFKLTANRWSPG
ncbi:SnoaL-like domain-containing protein [Amycolatopsis marina]|uniref:SnoaL-like domain-containing protein n=1 Tax=Amycolatopsis marina TaxID=490629 RepID=A0A1I0Z0T6_9PSEU|nr:nuclear transport factor 2 family protein [Amycolatopsis marina]SFB19224.1 SnoaL-like domain-containing protein [Amycolatopsis marina]